MGGQTPWEFDEGGHLGSEALLGRDLLPPPEDAGCTFEPVAMPGSVKRTRILFVVNVNTSAIELSVYVAIVTFQKAPCNIDSRYWGGHGHG